MELGSDFVTSGNYTKVPNDLIFHPVFRVHRAGALLHVWLMLASMAPRRGIQSQKHLANILAQKLGAEYSWETLKSHINTDGGKAWKEKSELNRSKSFEDIYEENQVWDM